MKRWPWHFLFTGVCLVLACAALFRSATNGLHAVAWGFWIPTLEHPWVKKPENLVKLHSALITFSSIGPHMTAKN